MEKLEKLEQNGHEVSGEVDAILVIKINICKRKVKVKRDDKMSKMLKSVEI